MKFIPWTMGREFKFLSLILLLSGGIPVSVWWFAAGRMDQQVAVALAATSVIGAIIAYRLSGRRAGPTEFTFLVYVYVFLCLAPIAQIAQMRWPREQQYSQSTIYAGFGIVLVGVFGFLFGTAIRWSFDFAGTRVVRYARQLSLAQTRMLVLGCIAVGASLGIFFLAGGWTTLGVSRDQRFLEVFSLAQGNALLGMLLYWGLRVPPFISLLLLIALVQMKERHGQSNGLLKLLIAVTALWNMVVSNPISSERYWLGTMGLSLMFLAAGGFWLRRRVAIFLLGVLVLVTVFTVMDMFRTRVSLAGVSSELSSLEQSKFLTEPDFDSFQLIMDSQSYVQAKDAYFPKQLLTVPLFWFPRAWWPDKPISTGALVSRYREYDNWNISMPLWGELYFGGGWVLVFMGFVFYGRLVRLCDMAYFRGQEAGNMAPVAIVSLFAGYQMFLLRGPLFGVWPPLAMGLIWMFVQLRRRGHAYFAERTLGAVGYVGPKEF